MPRLQWPSIVERAADIVTSYDQVGGCTLRQAYYRLVSEGLIPHTAPTYRRLSARLAQARREERFPDLLDPLREVHVSPAWPDAGAFLRAAPDWFALDRTAGQTSALYVACEKDTLRAQLTGWLEDTGVPVLVVRGFGSQSYVQVVRERTAHDPRPAMLLYVGDFDASGADIERDWVARTDCWTHVERILLTHEQVRDYELPAAAGKAGDPRWPGFARRYGLDASRPVQWEVEALDPTELQRLVLAAVAPYIDRPVLAARIAEEERQRRQLRAFAEGWPSRSRPTR
ncbi:MULTISPECIES: hypothetical protein [Streptomyces]|uniref:hypothetical protein n=1 Tax=Streptomyces TaxID=1883 RepID=UPI002109B8B2|nr:MULTISPECIES: hypothetical protein [Streptomyces]UUA11581.1 hypothetical protein NNW98_38870 [Streptomyces koelreuteriae]UUA19214.1 hypothetical protein NNW99_38945 [Streptomyces sp. CRCS-T-1]